MPQVLIITPTEIKNDSRIEINSDDKTLRELVFVAQETKLNSILGDVLFNRLIDAIYNYSSNHTAIAGSLVALIPYVKKYLLYQVVSDFIYVNHYKLTNKGTVKLTDGNSTSSSNVDIDWYKNYYDNATASYKKKLVEYLSTASLIDSNEVNSVDTDWSYRGVYMDIDNDYVPTHTPITSNISTPTSYKMTTTQRLNIYEEGVIVYDLDLHMLYVFDGQNWNNAWEFPQP